MIKKQREPPVHQLDGLVRGELANSFRKRDARAILQLCTPSLDLSCNIFGSWRSWGLAFFERATDVKNPGNVVAK
jgi:hypothetical protein